MKGAVTRFVVKISRDRRSFISLGSQSMVPGVRPAAPSKAGWTFIKFCRFYAYILPIERREAAGLPLSSCYAAGTDWPN
jgi:hypothetical protein